MLNQGMETMRRLISNFTVAFSGIKAARPEAERILLTDPLPPVQSGKLRCRLAPSGRDALKSPMGLAAAHNGDLVIADSGNHRVVILTPYGDIRSTFGHPGDADDCLNAPISVAVTSTGSVAVTDACHVKLFDPVTGNFLAILQQPRNLLTEPRGLAVTQNDYFVVSDARQHAIFVLWSTGECRSRFGQLGSGPGDLDRPESVAVTLDRRILVADAGNSAVKVFTFGGIPLHAYSWRDFRLQDPQQQQEMSCTAAAVSRPQLLQLRQQQQQQQQLLGITCDHDGNILVTLRDSVGLVLPSGRIWSIIDSQDGLCEPSSIVYVPSSQCIAVLESNILQGRAYILLYNHEPETLHPYRPVEDSPPDAQHFEGHYYFTNLVRTAMTLGKSKSTGSLSDVENL